MEVAYHACWIFGPFVLAIGAILVTNHLDSWGIWVIFASFVIIALGFSLFWQKKVWDKETAETSTEKAILPDEDVQKIVDGVVRELLAEKQSGKAVFGIANKKIIPTKVFKPRNLYVNWKSASIIKETKEKVILRFPYMRGDIGSNTNMTFGDNITTLYKRVGNKKCPYDFGTEKLCAEVVAVKSGVAVIRLSIERTIKK